MYDYTKVEYLNSKTKVIIVCPFHGDFLQAPSNHINGQGCPKCRTSKGEQKIQAALDKLGVNYESEYSFSDCFYKKPLPFDFAIFINDKIGLIEYNGEQHYQSVNYGNNQTSLSKRQKLDKIKKDYADKYDYPILVIAYSDFENIEKLIKIFINKTRTANNIYTK